MEARWQALLVLTAARTSLGVQFQSVASVSPQLIDQAGLLFADLGTLIGLYFAPGILVALPGGALGRRFGDRRVVLAGLALMAAGGIVMALAPGFAVLAAGRTISGIGAVLLNVVMAKMVTDWFAGREIVLAMSVFVNSFPVGIGLALLVLTPLGAALGWPAVMVAASLLALAALLLIALAYRPHPHDGAGAASGGRLSGAEVALVSLAGIGWAVLNGGLAVTFGFTPTFLASLGRSAAEAGVLVGAVTWLGAVSVQAGGVLAQRGTSPALLMAAGSLGWAGCFAVLASGAAPPGVALVAAGLLMGLPAGVLLSLPGRVLRPENRSLGMGLFYTWLYAGFATMPPAAGWLRDWTGSPAAPLWFTAALVPGMFLAFCAFQAGLARRARAPA